MIAGGISSTHRMKTGPSTQSVYNSSVIANDVLDASKQRAMLLSACGAGTYTLIRSLVTPNKPADYTFKQLVDLVGLSQPKAFCDGSAT